MAEELIGAKTTQKKQLGNILSQWLPARLAEGLLLANGFAPDARLADLPDARLRKLGDAINRWAIVPAGSEGQITDVLAEAEHRVVGAHLLAQAVGDGL